MPKIIIKSNMAQEAQRILILSDEFTDALVEGMRKSLQAIGLISAQDYLQGPRPQRLAVRSGKLIRALMGVHSFTGGLTATGGPSVSSQHGYREIKRIRDKLLGVMGVKDLPYADIWEKTGHGEIVPKKARALHFFTETGEEVFTKRVRAQRPRPFLDPAGKQAQSSGRLDQIFQEEIDQVKYD